MRKIFAVAAVLLLTAGSAYGADTNTNTIDQAGATQVANLTQVGSGNDAKIKQRGTDFQADVTQKGHDNIVDVKQLGGDGGASIDPWRDHVTVTQEGDLNEAVVKQGPDSSYSTVEVTQKNDENFAKVIQQEAKGRSALYNLAYITQSGGDRADVKQFGDTHEVHIDQLGSSNDRAFVTQEGNLGYVEITQSGGAGDINKVTIDQYNSSTTNFTVRAIVNQIGSNWSVDNYIFQNGEYILANLTQDGRRNIAEIDQTGNSLQANVSQTGNDNSVDIDQLSSTGTTIGYSQKVDVTQLGNGNDAIVDQVHVADGGVAQVATILQEGHGNGADIHQDGYDNNGDIHQGGLNDYAIIEQVQFAAGQNVASITQDSLVGDLEGVWNNYASIRQGITSDGGGSGVLGGNFNSATISQTGEWNDAQISQVYDNNDANITQDGFDNMAVVTQVGQALGTSGAINVNSSDITQVGDNLTANVSQTFTATP